MDRMFSASMGIWTFLALPRWNYLTMVSMYAFCETIKVYATLSLVTLRPNSQLNCPRSDISKYDDMFG